MSEISDKIEQVAQGPQSVSTDGTTITQPNIKDLIEADKYLSQKTASAKPWRLMKIARIGFPGATH